MKQTRAASDCPFSSWPSRPTAGGFARSCAGFALLAAIALGAATSASAEKFAKWDQVANIKDAATRLAQLQKTQGASKAFAFIDACYKTHSLNSEYTSAFEACITQDYLETQVLALIYSRLPPERLKQLGAPSPDLLAKAMGQRVTTAFASYKVPVSYAKDFKTLVDKHGFPVFFEALFPGVKPPDIKPPHEK